MAIDSRVPLAGQGVELGRSALSGAVAGNALMNMVQERQNAPLVREAAQMELEAGKIKLTKEKALEQLRRAAFDAQGIKVSLASGDVKRARDQLVQRRADIIARDGANADTSHTDEWIAALESGDPAKIQGFAAELNEIERAYQQYGGGSSPTGGQASAKTKQYVDGTVQMVMPDGSVQVKTPDQRIVTGAEAAAALQQAMANEVSYAGQKAGSAAYAQQGAKLDYAMPIAQSAQLGQNAGAMGGNGIPSSADIERQVADAKEAAKREAELATTQRLNAVALDVYQTGMAGLKSALGKTSAGPVAGRIPAITANAQIAEGAISAIAPVLKQMFRAAGEGVFTDKDQQLLIDMIPKRTDHPAAQAAKMQNIDAIVAAKLGGGAMPTPPPGAQPSSAGQRTGGQLMEDANGNRAIVYPDGTVEEQ